MSSPAAADPIGAPVDASLEADLALALRLAGAADGQSLPRFDAADLAVRSKPDRTRVTDADLAVERAIRDILAAERPADGVLGEEFGASGDSRRQWIIDPIDGTHGYLRGIPIWGTMIALAIDGEPRIGVVSAPQLGRRWWAARGHGAWTTSAGGAPTRLRTSQVSDMGEASVCFQSLAQWDAAGRLPALVALTRAAWRDRAFGDVWSYMLLAEGRLELVAEFDLKPYDIAAAVPIIVEAGGRVTDVAGTDTIWADSTVASNGPLHDDVLALLHAHSEADDR